MFAGLDHQVAVDAVFQHHLLAARVELLEHAEHDVVALGAEPPAEDDTAMLTVRQVIDLQYRPINTQNATGPPKEGIVFRWDHRAFPEPPDVTYVHLLTSADLWRPLVTSTDL